MLGKIALEEAWELPEVEQAWKERWGKLFPAQAEERAKQIVDITGQRLALAKKHGVGYQILSHTAPGVQGVSDPKEAEDLATHVNDYIAGAIRGHEHFLGAFAALSMHDPTIAAAELRRCVQQYHFKGALVNNTQRTGINGEKDLFYDQPQWDSFWSTCEDLNVPVYIHPRQPTGKVFENEFKDREFLMGPILGFSHGVALSILGLIVNGVFDRHPKLQIIIGHLGEKLPFDFYRINHWSEDGPNKPFKKTIFEYFNENIWITTTGQHSTSVLNFVINMCGTDRIMFSVDYPYETFDDACNWFDGAYIPIEVKRKIGRDNARRMFKLSGFDGEDAPV